MTRVSLMLCILCAGLLAGEWRFDPQLSAEGEQIVRVVLTPNEIAMLGEQTDWLRLHNRNGQEVPFALAMEFENTVVSRKSVMPCDITQLRTQDDGTVEIICELKKGIEVPEQLTVRFSTGVRDFEQLVRIFGATADGWKLLCDDGFIFDSSRLLDLRNLAVSFQRAGCRKFRFLLSQGNFEFKSALRHIVDSESSTSGTTHSESADVKVTDFKMDGIELLGVVETSSVGGPCLRPVPARSLVQDSNYRYTVNPCFYPVYGLEVDSDSSNFSRRLSVASAASGYSIVENATINRLRLNGYSQEQTRVCFSPVKEEALLLSLDSDIAIPLNLTAASCLSPCYSLTFIGSATEAPYCLIGQECETAPHYDTDGIIQFGHGRIAPKNITLEQCGEFVGEPYIDRRPSLELPGKKLNLRMLLIAAVGIAAIAMIFSLAKVIKNTSPRQ